MAFISYAQNYEDVILWRALKHVENGSYIDVGAHDPVGDSVSLAFYERGWRGVHIEPVSYYADKLRSARPDETILQSAIGASTDIISFFEVGDTGLSTGDEEIARRHEAAGYGLTKTTVPCIPLSGVLGEDGERQIHWLKIDVEGMEREVIESWLPSPVRPWIVVVESTLPNSPEPAYEDWEPQLLGLGYEFVYFDGLNRFYVSEHHQELTKYFGPGPNFFDDFTLSVVENLHRVVSEQSLQIQQLSGESEITRGYVRALEQQNEQLKVLHDKAKPTHEAENSYQHRLETLKGEFAQRTAALADENSRLTQHARVLAEENVVLTKRLTRLYRSSSWRMMAPWRAALSALRTAGRAIRQPFR